MKMKLVTGLKLIDNFISLKMEAIDKDSVIEMRKKGYTYKKISEILMSTHPSVRGLSEHSVQRYCKRWGIDKMDNVELDEVVAEAVGEVS